MTLKEQAAMAGADLVKSGMALGLGTGSTATCLVREIGHRLREGSLEGIRGVPTSIRTARLAKEEGIPLVTLEESAPLDLTLDGADEVDPDWNLIKGGGGCLLREKIVAQASTKEVILVDQTKLVSRLGEASPLPVEVTPFGWQDHRRFFHTLGGDATLRLDPEGGTFLTDEGNFILDIRFSDPQALVDLEGLNQKIRSRAGVIETGLFLGMTSILIVARSSGVEVLTQKP